MQFSEIARRVMAKAGKALALDERGTRGPQPVEMIPGMTAAAEPCCLAGAHWAEALHPAHALAQPKIDGIRALALQTRIVTRQALPLDAALHCLPALDRLEKRFGEAMVFDGEYQEPEGFAATLAAHKRGMGAGVFWLFDAVPYAEWRANAFTMPLQGRLARIADLAGHDEPFLCFMPALACPTPADARALASAAWAAGGEGVVVKAGRGKYVRGRSTDWLKLKRAATLDGPVVDVVIPGGDIERGVALVRLGGKVHKVAAMPAVIREMLAGDKRDGDCGALTGRMVEVEFMERTESGALRGARIVRLRPDKEKGES